MGNCLKIKEFRSALSTRQREFPGNIRYFPSRNPSSSGFPEFFRLPRRYTRYAQSRYPSLEPFLFSNVLSVLPNTKGKKGFKITEVPIVVSYEGKTSTQHPISHGVSVSLSTLKFISIEHPLNFYGIPGLISLAIGLIFTIMTIQGFTQTRQILLGTAVIGVGTIIFGTVLLMTSIILYSVVNLIRENSSK